MALPLLCTVSYLPPFPKLEEIIAQPKVRSYPTKYTHEVQKSDTSFNNFANPEHLVLPFLIDIAAESVTVFAIQKMVELRRCCGRPRLEWI